MTRIRHATALLLLVALSLLPQLAGARCSLTNGSTLAVNISFASSTITINPTAAIGTTLATSSPVVPSPVDDLNCTRTTSYGVQNLVGANPSAGSTIYPTNVPGLGYRIAHPDSSNYLTPYPGNSIPAGTYTLSVASAFELVKTGTIANGAVLNAGTLSYWNYGGLEAEDFNLASSLTFVYPSCTVNNSAINVVLPTVSNTGFNGVGSVAGATAFAISLNCSAGSTMSIQFDTAAPFGGAPGVIAPASGAGRAQNIGVQLINQSFAPITFGTPAVVGATPNGPLNLSYYARYYQTASPVSAGTVNATATFTLTYQ
ncbi:fimbrial protein [Dyella subtropica]|uniref:fimbrial protein n=1 Tax=Dyella subtropica TaxID=2992127 RepID=UPI002254E4D4|nr:fimbrial protein [Dyella subtropica]